MKIKTFTAFGDIDEKVNRWLQDNKHIHIVTLTTNMVAISGDDVIHKVTLLYEDISNECNDSPA